MSRSVASRNHWGDCEWLPSDEREVLTATRDGDGWSYSIARYEEREVDEFAFFEQHTQLRIFPDLWQDIEAPEVKS